MHDNIEHVEHEQEGHMAKSDLYRSAKCAIKLFELIEDSQDLEAWVQSKITKAADYLDSVYHYLEYELKYAGQKPHGDVESMAGDHQRDLALDDEHIDLSSIAETTSYDQQLANLLEAAQVNEASLNPGNKTPNGTANHNADGITSRKIFFARSNKAPKDWSYDHVGFITHDGKQIQMSGHKGNNVYVTKSVSEDPEFPKQNIKIISLSKPISVPMTNTVGAENCGTFVANVLQANGITNMNIQKIYSIFKKTPTSTATPSTPVATANTKPSPNNQMAENSDRDGITSKKTPPSKKEKCIPPKKKVSKNLKDTKFEACAPAKISKPKSTGAKKSGTKGPTWENIKESVSGNVIEKTTLTESEDLTRIKKLSGL